MTAVAISSIDDHTKRSGVDPICGVVTQNGRSVRDAEVVEHPKRLFQDQPHNQRNQKAQ